MQDLVIAEQSNICHKFLRTSQNSEKFKHLQLELLDIKNNGGLKSCLQACTYLFLFEIQCGNATTFIL